MEFHQSPTVYVKEVHVKVKNIELSIQFYENIIGLKTLYRTEKTASFTTDGRNVLLKIEQVDRILNKKIATAGLYHFALLLPERKHLANVVRHFTKIGVPFGSGDHLVSEAIYLSDPDGHGIEIYWDRDPSTWTWNDDEVEMATNPVDLRNLLSENKEEAWRSLPEDTMMGHIHLQVGNMAENERFYIDGLGFNIVSRFGERALFISDNRYHHHIALNTWGGVGIPNQSKNTVGIESYTLQLPNVKSREKLIERLQKIGATVSKNDGNYFTYDPSNIRVYLEVNI